MTAESTSWLGRWEAYWFDRVPPHSAAMLRISFGALALVALVGLTPVEMFWSLDGLSPRPGNPIGPRAWLIDQGLGTAAGWTFFIYSAVAAMAMLVGYRSDLAVFCTFVGLVLQTHWNRLPLSSAHQVAIAVLFCLVWSETGRVWSVDSWRKGAPGDKLGGEISAWPLRLVRCQVAVIYFGSALSKLSSAAWLDGYAVHWALNLNEFHRFPWPLPVAVEPATRVLTWVTLAFELLFPVVVWPRTTRVATLLTGIGLHLGLFLMLEVGLFSWVMIASYLAFLDPHDIARFARRLARSS